LSPKGPHTDAGVEAAFLQMYKAWESLLEECTLAFMCGRLRCDGKLVPALTVSKDEEWARRAMYQERSYLEWTNVDKNIERWNAVFVQPNIFVDAIRPATAELKHMSTIRNMIAHSSVLARRKFAEFVQGQFGGRRYFNRPAELLSTAWPQDASMTFFDRFAHVFETIAPNITG
jgi:hypothetical protein